MFLLVLVVIVLVFMFWRTDHKQLQNFDLLIALQKNFSNFGEFHTDLLTYVDSLFKAGQSSVDIGKKHWQKTSV